MIRGTRIISTKLSRKINSCKRFCSTSDKTKFGGDENMNYTTSKHSIFSRPMEEQFNSFNLGVTWTEFGDQRESDLDKLLDSLSDLTTQNRTKLVSLWKRHPDKQQAGDDSGGGSNIEASLKDIRKAIDRQERNSSGYVEDKVRDNAGSMFGFSTMKTFLVKCLYDLIVLSNPHEYSHEDIVAGENQLEAFVRSQFVPFVQAYYLHLKSTVADPSGVLSRNPWVVNDQVVAENIKACGGVLNNSQRGFAKRIKKATEPEDNVMSIFRRSTGPGLSVVVWCACGEFLSEVELDCRGKVDLLLTTKRAVVMGAEIKTSASGIPYSKKQLIRRFKIIAQCLQVTHGIPSESCIFVGRVFYRNADESSTIVESEDGSGNNLGTLSFYYHRI